ncbi:plastid division protein PDV2-like [Bidens hawaiensis]|uniref:plastid division protein PDV2-like n=1 Tax=Bidens hawaiensis TaxID=980011 RepID=UPI004049E6DB
MDEDGIALVLARASELRSKLTNCIQNASSTPDDGEEEEEEEADGLLNIRDSLEVLEAQLTSLQALQQQQWYEKEASLAEIDYSRKKLLQKLKAYKGDDLEVICEATAFASSAVEMESNDLLLPPYPTRPTASHFPITNKITQNDSSNGEPNGTVHQPTPKSPLKRLTQIIGSAAKTVITVVGFIAVLHLSGFEPKLDKRGSVSQVLGVTQDNGNEEKTEKAIVCPPGKILVVENGVTRCLVKERVEIPFKSVATNPDVNYGCG